MQSHLDSHETFEATVDFEKMCLDQGVTVKKFLSNDGSAFTSHGHREHLEEFKLHADHSAPGAHHQNAMAERAIHTITSMA